MNYAISTSFSNEGTRNDVRMRVVNYFANEVPGTGIGILASHYIYYVETLSDGSRVYLQRPANLHNGFDFLICVEGANYAQPGTKVRYAPKHEDIRNDLLMKKSENPSEYSKLYSLAQRIYECHDVSDFEMASIRFRSGLPVDHVLKVLKWMFIEQDIRYWNYSGRITTWTIVPEPFASISLI